MKISASCIRCLVERQEERIRQFAEEDIKSRYMKEVLRIIAESDEEASAPYLVAQMRRKYREYFGDTEDFAEIKHRFNQMMLEKEHQIREIIHTSKDPLRYALTFARIGNYIDFGAMHEVDTKILEKMIQSAEADMVEERVYKLLLRELKTASTLVYLVDNCGEVVLDKLAIECLKEQYPELDIAVIVRGQEVLNDVTMTDAEETGLTEIIWVLENGSDVAGTQLNCINAETLAAINEADIIISKGQGNFETLNGCGLNIYYLFLCKCDWFVKRFGLARNAGAFVREKEWTKQQA
ncbi:MAG: DUF89 family protein [Lachnospiraceae bacterium]|nr:DUF89 family protein [Lachnospiraceae bacterium]